MAHAGGGVARVGDARHSRARGARIGLDAEGLVANAVDSAGVHNDMSRFLYGLVLNNVVADGDVGDSNVGRDGALRVSRHSATGLLGWLCEHLRLRYRDHRCTCCAGRRCCCPC